MVQTYIINLMPSQKKKKRKKKGKRRTIRGRDIRWLTVTYMEEISDQAISTWLITLCDYLVFIFLNLRIKFPGYGLKATVIFMI